MVVRVRVGEGVDVVGQRLPAWTSLLVMVSVSQRRSFRNGVRFAVAFVGLRRSHCVRFVVMVVMLLGRNLGVRWLHSVIVRGFYTSLAFISLGALGLGKQEVVAESLHTLRR